jgi:hypothetical protein
MLKSDEALFERIQALMEEIEDSSMPYDIQERDSDYLPYRLSSDGDTI